MISLEVADTIRQLLSQVNPKTRDEAALLVRCYDELEANTATDPQPADDAISNT